MRGVSFGLAMDALIEQHRAQCRAAIRRGGMETAMFLVRMIVSFQLGRGDFTVKLKSPEQILKKPMRNQNNQKHSMAINGR